jgi:hypothetical protein
VLTFRAGDPDRPRGHALLFFRDADDPDVVWATYLVVAPIQMDLGKYIPAAFATQLAGQLSSASPSAYPLPPVPEKIEGGLAWLERVASVRADDLLDGGTLRMSDPLYALQPVSDVGTQYAEACTRYLSEAPGAEPARGESASSSVDVDELLMQVMPDSEKVGRLARLAGTLRYAIEGGDTRQADETVSDMQRVARHLSDKYRPAELIAAARSTDEQSAQLAQLYIERCYRLVEEDYAALAELDSRIDALKGLSSRACEGSRQYDARTCAYVRQARSFGSQARLRMTVSALVAHPHQQHGTRGVAQHGIGRAAEDQAAQARAAVGGHRDQAHAQRLRAFEDRVCGVAFGQLDADRDALLAQPRRHAGQVLAGHGPLRLDDRRRIDRRRHLSHAWAAGRGLSQQRLDCDDRAHQRHRRAESASQRFDVRQDLFSGFRPVQGDQQMLVHGPRGQAPV